MLPFRTGEDFEGAWYIPPPSGPESGLALEGQAIPIIPGKPHFRSRRNFGAVFEKCRKVLEGIFSGELTSLDQAHEDIPDVRSPDGLVKVTVLPM